MSSSRASFRSSPRSASDCSADLGGLIDDGQLDVAHQPARRASVDQPGAQTPGGLGAARDAEAQTLVRRTTFVARCQIAGQEGVSGPAAGDRLAPLDARPLEAALTRDEHLRGELVADELLRLEHVR